MMNNVEYKLNLQILKTKLGIWAKNNKDPAD
jgi:hypothetical protein